MRKCPSACADEPSGRREAALEKRRAQLDPVSAARGCRARALDAVDADLQHNARGHCSAACQAIPTWEGGLDSLVDCRAAGLRNGRCRDCTLSGEPPLRHADRYRCCAVCKAGCDGSSQIVFGQQACAVGPRPSPPLHHNPPQQTALQHTRKSTTQLSGTDQASGEGLGRRGSAARGSETLAARSPAPRSPQPRPPRSWLCPGGCAGAQGVCRNTGTRFPLAIPSLLRSSRPIHGPD
jgi:hypothetical protein